MAVNNSRAEMEKLNERIKELTAENEAYKACVSQYEEDFKHEREDRIRAVKEKISIEEELKAYKKAGNEVPQSKKQGVSKGALVKENEHLKIENEKMNSTISSLDDLLHSKQKELDAVKANLEAMENIMQKQLKDLYHQLNEAKEEIAVKVAQVKQYQKQVEAYKQASQPPDVRTRDCKSTSSSQLVHPEHSDPSLRGQAQSACDGDYRSNPSSTPSQNAASNCVPDGGSKLDDIDDDLPPPIFNRPFQPMNHPAVAHGLQKEGIPLSQHQSSKPSALLHNRVGHTYGNPPPSTANLPQSVELADGLDDDISRMAAAVLRETGYPELEETNIGPRVSSV